MKSPHTVGIYINSYKKHGTEGPNIGKSTLCPRFLTNKQEEELYKAITTKIRDESGFGYRKNWNSNIARKWFSNNFNVEYQRSATLAKSDHEKQETSNREFEVKKI